MDVWPNSKQLVLSISIFDHCALVLKTALVDWGTKPFRSLDVWQSDKRLLDFVWSKWQSYEVLGGGMFVLK